MKWTAVATFHAMSEAGGNRIFDALAAAGGAPFHLGLATGNTMLELYRLLAEKINSARLDLTQLHTWNLDEYAGASGKSVPPEHPLSYRKYMAENFFQRLDPALGTPCCHFPEEPERFDAELAGHGGLDFQLLGIGFNGHIAFNEPQPGADREAFGALPSRLIQLAELTIETNRKLTANGANIVPTQAFTMGMKQILGAKRHLLLACFPEQRAPLGEIRKGTVTPVLPASYLLETPDCEIIYTKDTIPELP